MKHVLVLMLATLPPAVQPWPIGAGPRYQPPAAPAAVRAGQPVGSFRCGSHAARFAVHLELFANRRVIVVPAGIGVGRGCVYPLHTTAPTGIVNVGSLSATVGDLFRIWGQALGPRRLLSFASTAGIAAFVDGRRRAGDPRSIRLTPHAQIVLEIRGYVPPHPSYLFPKGTP